MEWAGLITRRGALADTHCRTRACFFGATCEDPGFGQGSSATRRWDTLDGGEPLGFGVICGDTDDSRWFVGARSCGFGGDIGFACPGEVGSGVTRPAR